MKNSVVIYLLALFLAGCADKNQYEQAVLEQLQADKDIKDYSIDPQHMADCVVQLSSKQMPGLFPLDPDRMIAYRNYTQMLSLNHSDDPKKTLEELRASFGSPKALADAHSNYTESVINCMSAIVMDSEDEAKEKDKS